MSNLSAAMTALKNKTKEEITNRANQNTNQISGMTAEELLNKITTINNSTGTPSVVPAINKWQIAQNNMKKLQVQIKTERKAQNMTQKKLAILSGFSQGTITRAENNGWISIGCLLAISNALGKEIALVTK